MGRHTAVYIGSAILFLVFLVFYLSFYTICFNFAATMLACLHAYLLVDVFISVICVHKWIRELLMTFSEAYGVIASAD